MKVGLPSALLNPYYISFWKPFFEELSQEIIMTPETTKEILDKGIRHTVPEICVPIKIYVGHIIELIEKGADKIYIPRFVSIRKQDAFCPKFLALPDLLISTISGLKDKILTHWIESKDDNIATISNFLEIGKILTGDTKLIHRAIKLGNEKWTKFRELCCKEHYS